MNNRPLISVIVPMYNCGEYIESCLASLVGQTYENIEIIVVDDGSTDNGGDICRTFAERDGRIKYIYQQNGGVSAARNNALDHVNGEWISFCDSDDYAEPDMLEHLIRTALGSNADIVQCGVMIEFSDRSEQLPCPEREQTVSDFSQAEKSALRFYGKTVYPKLFRRELLNGLRFDSTYPIGEDMLFGVQAAMRAKKIVMTNEYKYHYFQRAGSVCNAAPTAASLVSSRNALNEILRLLPEKCKAAEHYFDEQLRNDLDMCSKFARFSPENSSEVVKEVRNELKSNLRYILKNGDFSEKEKLKTRMIVNAWRFYSLIVRRKKREVLQN